MSAETLQSASGEFESGNRTTAFKEAIARCFTDIETQTKIRFLTLRSKDGIIFGYTDMTRSNCFFQSEFMGKNGETHTKRYETIGINTAKMEFVENDAGDVVHISAPLTEVNFRPDPKGPNSHSSQELNGIREVMDQIDLGGKRYIEKHKVLFG